MRNESDILAAAGLPAELGDLWVAEALVDGNGESTFHVGRLAEVLNMNDVQIGRGTSSNYTPFALCLTAEQALDTVERMKARQAGLAAMAESENVCIVEQW